MEDLKRELNFKTIEILNKAESIETLNSIAGNYFKVLDLDETIKKILTLEDLKPEDINELLTINKEFLKDYDNIILTLEEIKENVLLLNVLLRIAHDKIKEVKE